MNGNFFVKGSKWTAAAGSLALLPALFLVSIGLMFSFGSRELGDLLLTRVYSGEWYWRIAHPVFVLGGLVSAFLINSFSVASFDVRRTKEEVGFSLKVRKSVLNLVVMAVAAITLLILLAYAFGETLSYPL
ncbi:MAG: hypothetical protein ACRDFQ_06905 [Anaerolineales bacterium]